MTRSFQCADGEFIGIHTGAAGAFGRLMEVLGLDDRIRPTESKVDMGVPLTPDEAAILEQEIHGIFAGQTRAYWVERLLRADICAVEHLRAGSVFDQPQARHNAMTVRIDDAHLGVIDQVAPGIRFNGVAPLTPTRAPVSGEHASEILGALEERAPSVWRKTPAASLTPNRRPLLADVKILDLGAYYAGPFSSRLLADMGAQVIKVETLVGDQLRGIERPFFAAQAGKRSLSADLKSPALARAVQGLIGWADVVHHNMRPGAAERLGLGAEQVRALNPNAIYLYAPGWGSTGPNHMRQSFAPMLSGYVGASYEVAGEFNEPLPSVGNEDPGNGLLGAAAMLMALLHRRVTGVALACENPQLNAAMGMMAHIVRTASGDVIGTTGLDVLQMGRSALESLYETADGWICIAVREDLEFEGLARVLGNEALRDPNFSSAEGRTAHRDALTDILRDAFAERSTAAWLTDLAKAGVPAAEPAGPGCIHALMNDPAERIVGRVAEVSHPELGNVREIAKLVRVSEAVAPPHRLAPGLGEHTDEILRHFGYEDSEIAELRARGHVR